MTKLRISLSLIMLTVFVASCAAGTQAVAPTELAPLQPSATDPVAVPVTNTPAQQNTAVPTEAPPATAVAVATSRGPELHATDPTTVNLASGGLQFVEFFEFW